MLGAARPAAETALPPAVSGPAFLQDGTEVWVRPVRLDDRPLVADFLARTSSASLAERYFATLRPAVAEQQIVAVTPADDRLCLLVLGDRSDTVAVLGVGEYARLAPGVPVAEVAFLVDDAFRGRGIATLLLVRLARAGRGFGLRCFEARVRRENPEMLEVFRGSGRWCEETAGEDEVTLRIPLGPEAGAPVGPPVRPQATRDARRR